MGKQRWRPFRRPRIWVAVVTLMALATGFYAWRNLVGCRRPNVLLITLDTTRADRLACYGYSSALTPALDALATEGVLFERAYTPAPMTLPSHASMMTGLFPPEHGLVSNGRERLDENISTFAEVFRDAGYDTGGFIASFVLHSTFGLQRGFSKYDDDMTHTDPTEFGLHRQRDGREVVDSALAWLQQPRGRPFFCWVHLYDAHEPYVPHTDEFGDRFQEHPYDGEIAYVDRQVGRLVKHLEANGLKERTLVVVVGDHGEGLGDHDENGHGLTLYNSVLQVPWIWAGRGVAAAGRRIPQPVSLVDLRPTLLATVGLRDPARVSGRSLRTALTAGEIETRECYSATDFPLLVHGWCPQRCLTTAGWKYIRSAEVELYDMKSDSQETRNLAAARPSQVEALEEQLAALEQTMVQRLGAAVELTPRQRRALESFGYLGGQNSGPRPGATDKPLPDVKRMLPICNRIDAAQQLLFGGNPVAAETQLREIVGEVPDYIPAQNLLAEVLARQEKFAESRDILERVLKLDPDDSQAHFQLGALCWEMQQFADAVAEFRKSLAINPYGTGAMFSLAQSLLQLGQVADAEQLYRQVLEQYPIHVLAHVALGNLLASQRRAVEAEQHYREALKYSPGLVEAHHRLAVLLASRQRAADAGAHFKRALELAPKNAELHFNYGTFLFHQGRIDEAIDRLEEALQLNPEDSQTRTRLQQAHELRRKK